MVEIKEDRTNTEIYFEISNLVTRCPHTKDLDVTDAKLTYKPGSPKHIVNKDDFKKCLEKVIENQPVAMEIIPLLILSCLIQNAVSRSPHSRDASPEYVEVNTTSRGSGKKFTISTSVWFEREVK
ncbi:MAG: hypothetical protein N3A69_08905 [Leptospiraceae bacterium]|nr:hypothetical protein [Leptospiraceae bacterium]